MSNSLRPHELQNAKLLCPSLSPGVFSNSYLLSCWCHPTIILFSSLFLLPSIFSNMSIISNELTLHIRWPKYCYFFIKFLFHIQEVPFIPCVLSVYKKGGLFFLNFLLASIELITWVLPLFLFDSLLLHWLIFRC